MQDLKDHPDPWFQKPSGWVKKPQSFKRPTNILSAYNHRWFVLDIARHKFSYHRDDHELTSESGFIDMTTITDIRPSALFDAAECALDLLSSERIYTIITKSQATMIRWGVALRLSMPQASLSFSDRESLAVLVPSMTSLAIREAAACA